MSVVGSELATSAVLIMIVLAVLLWPSSSYGAPISRRPREEGPRHPYRRRVTPDP
jgi:hypothetical protein